MFGGRMCVLGLGAWPSKDTLAFVVSYFCSSDSSFSLPIWLKLFPLHLLSDGFFVFGLAQFIASCDKEYGLNAPSLNFEDCASFMGV